VTDFEARAARALQGNLETQRDKLASQHKLFVRDRLDLLLDEGSFVEDGLLANALAPSDDLPADGVVTGIGTIDGRPGARGERARSRRSSA
jgi:acetyl-CoA carboxylase carboxyltransferase component